MLRQHVLVGEQGDRPGTVGAVHAEDLVGLVVEGVEGVIRGVRSGVGVGVVRSQEHEHLSAFVLLPERGCRAFAAAVSCVGTHGCISPQKNAHQWGLPGLSAAAIASISRHPGVVITATPTTVDIGCGLRHTMRPEGLPCPLRRCRAPAVRPPRGHRPLSRPPDLWCPGAGRCSS